MSFNLHESFAMARMQRTYEELPDDPHAECKHADTEDANEDCRWRREEDTDPEPEHECEEWWHE